MNHDIDINTARELISNFHEQTGKIVALCYKKEKLEKLLCQKNCEGLRVYLALNQNGDTTLVIAGYDNNGKDIGATLAEYVAEYGIASIDVTSPLIT